MNNIFVYLHAECGQTSLHKLVAFNCGVFSNVQNTERLCDDHWVFIASYFAVGITVD